MKVKVMIFKDYDFGNIMDTIVFKEEADLVEIKEKVNEVFQSEEGERPYIDIIDELYGHLRVNVVENIDIYW